MQTFRQFEEYKNEMLQHLLGQSAPLARLGDQCSLCFHGRPDSVVLCMDANFSQKRLSKQRAVVVPAQPPPLFLGADAIALMEQQVKDTDPRKPKTVSSTTPALCCYIR